MILDIVTNLYRRFHRVLGNRPNLSCTTSCNTCININQWNTEACKHCSPIILFTWYQIDLSIQGLLSPSSSPRTKTLAATHHDSRWDQAERRWASPPRWRTGQARGCSFPTHLNKMAKPNAPFAPPMMSFAHSFFKPPYHPPFGPRRYTRLPT